MPKRLFGVLLAVMLTATGLTGLVGLSTTATAANASPEYTATIKTAIDDIQQYWSQEFPRVYGKPYDPISTNRIIAAEPGVKIPNCDDKRQTYKNIAENAFYCFGADFIAFDNFSLFPAFYKNYGSFGPAVILAHEWGHAIQDRSGNTAHSSISLEQQADCFAGAWTGYIANSPESEVEFTAGDLDNALSALLYLSDSPGTSAKNPAAHGSGFDRIRAFQDGFDSGAELCATYFENPPEIFEIPFVNKKEKKTGGEIAGNKVVSVTADLLNAFYVEVMPDYSPLPLKRVFTYNSSKSRKQYPECGGRVLTKDEISNRIFYCIDDDYVAFDEDYVQYIYDDIGDFGVMVLFSNAWATYALLQQEFPGAAENTDAAVDRADCYTGGFSAAVWNGYLKSKTLGGKVLLSAGDLDEAILALLDYSSARNAGGFDLTFTRFRSFRNGFLHGYGFCQAE